jgi:hypothetical protein
MGIFEDFCPVWLKRKSEEELLQALGARCRVRFHVNDD